MQGKKLRGEDNPYSRPKIDEMRKAFKLAEPHLTLAHPQTQIDALELRKQMMLDQAARFFADAPDKLLEFRNLLKKAKTEREFKEANLKLAKLPEAEYEYDTADDELIERLNEGWEHYKDTENGTVIIRRKRL